MHNGVALTTCDDAEDAMTDAGAHRYTWWPWLFALLSLGAAYFASGMISLRAPRLILLMIAIGLLYGGVAVAFRSRLGLTGLILWTVAIALIGSRLFGPAAADALDTWPASGWKVAFSILAPALFAAAVWSYRAGRVHAHSHFQRQFPLVLSAFGVGLCVGAIATVVWLMLTTPITI